MNDFDYDVMCKKQLARDARAKKNGSKSKKCTLPYELMSRKEIKSMHGDVITYQMNKPMKYDDFKAMPEDLRKEYIRSLVRKFDICSSQLGEMFGTSNRTALFYMHEAGCVQPRGHVVPQACKDSWVRWLNGEEIDRVAEECFNKDTESCEAVLASTPTAEGATIPELPSMSNVSKPAATLRTISAATLQFEGKTEEVAHEIFRFLAQFGGNCSITLDFEQKSDN